MNKIDLYVQNHTEKTLQKAECKPYWYFHIEHFSSTPHHQHNLGVWKTQSARRDV